MFDDMNAIGTVNFRFKDQSAPMDAVLGLCSAAQHYPPEHLLRYPYVFSTWQPEQVQEYSRPQHTLISRPLLLPLLAYLPAACPAAATAVALSQR